jgi:hypothetical protein
MHERIGVRSVECQSFPLRTLEGIQGWCASDTAEFFVDAFPQVNNGVSLTVGGNPFFNSDL